jgi:hypothetical protein
MEPVRSTKMFEVDREAIFSLGVTTRSKSKATRRIMLQTGGVSLPELPVDAQCCVFTFLAHYDLARCSAVSRACRAVATLDHLWEPFLADQFFAVKLDRSDAVLGTKPAFQFIVLAQARCTVCEESVMKPKSKSHRYPGAHSCSKCEELCCAACSCQCACLAACGVDREEDRSREVEKCTNCLQWCRWSCAESKGTILILFCGICLSAYCDHSWDCLLRLCSLMVCGKVSCEECLDMDWCDICYQCYCEGCRDVAFCQNCHSNFCSTCRVVGYCATCEVSYCDSCGHSVYLKSKAGA